MNALVLRFVSESGPRSKSDDEAYGIFDDTGNGSFELDLDTGIDNL